MGTINEANKDEECDVRKEDKELLSNSVTLQFPAEHLLSTLPLLAPIDKHSTREEQEEEVAMDDASKVASQSSSE